MKIMKIKLSILSEEKRRSIEIALGEAYLSDEVVVITPEIGMSVQDYKREELDVIKTYMFPLTNTADCFEVSLINYYHVLGIAQHVKESIPARDVKLVLLNWKDDKGLDRCELIKFVGEIASKVDTLIRLSLKDNVLTLGANIDGKVSYNTTLGEFNKLVVLSYLEYPYKVLLRKLNMDETMTASLNKHIFNFLLDICKQYLTKEEDVSSNVLLHMATQADKLSIILYKDKVEEVKLVLNI